MDLLDQIDSEKRNWFKGAHFVDDIDLSNNKKIISVCTQVTDRP